MLHNVAEFLSALLSAFARQLVLGFGLVAILGVLLSLSQRWIFLYLYRVIGLRGVVWSTGWLGTPIHELSHVIVAVACGIKVTKVQLYDPDPDDGKLGFVRYIKPELKPTQLHKVVGTFLLGIAPLFGGGLVLLSVLYLVCPGAPLVFEAARKYAQMVVSAPPDAVLRGFVELLRTTYHAIFLQGALSWRPWVFLYVSMCVGAHLAPSRADMEGGLVGFLVVLGLGLFANAIALLLGANPQTAGLAIARFTGPLAALLLIALVLNAGNLVLSFLLSYAFGRRA